jgi:glutamyl-tRNA reductase
VLLSSPLAAALAGNNLSVARAEVLARAKQQLAAGEHPDAVLDFLAHTLTNRLLHAPTIALREAALSGDAELARATDKLFPASAAASGDDSNT